MAATVGNYAVIVNSGLIQSTGDQDSIDLDSGDITNSGTLRSLGREDGIDFDAGGLVRSRVRTTGHIEGRIELGAGNDTLAVMTRQLQVLTFGSVPETLTIRGGDGFLLVSSVPSAIPAAAPQPAVIAITIPALVIDEAPISSPDRLSREIGMGIGGSVLEFQADEGLWRGPYANGGAIAPDTSQGADSRPVGPLWAMQPDGWACHPSLATPKARAIWAMATPRRVSGGIFWALACRARAVGSAMTPQSMRGARTT